MTKVADINSAARQVSDIINSIKGDMSSTAAPASTVDLGSAQGGVSASSIDQIKESLTKNQNERG